MRQTDTKAKDQAIGTSFGEHVMAGYKVYAPILPSVSADHLSS